MNEHDMYEESREIHPVLGWALLVLISLMVMGFATWLHMLFKDHPRQWNFGAAPSAPSESIYSTVMPPRSLEGHLQMEPLPGAKPLKEEPAAGAASEGQGQ